MSSKEGDTDTLYQKWRQDMNTIPDEHLFYDDPEEDIRRLQAGWTLLKEESRGGKTIKVYKTESGHYRETTYPNGETSLTRIKD
jgi:hypothetical protein